MGIFVGEVLATGDREKDIEITRQFLKQGLYKEATKVQAMIRQARSFSRTAAYLHRKDWLIDLR
jgi:hypothetical protein